MLPYRQLIKTVTIVMVVSTRQSAAVAGEVSIVSVPVRMHYFLSADKAILSLSYRFPQYFQAHSCLTDYAVSGVGGRQRRERALLTGAHMHGFFCVCHYGMTVVQAGRKGREAGYWLNGS